MAGTDVTFRLYRPGDEIGITALFKDVFGRQMTPEEWRWKYIESYGSKVYSAVALHSEMGIVGHYGGVCLPLIYNGNSIHGLAICDVMIHPKFRGIRTLKNLSFLPPQEAVKDGIRLGYGFPNRDTLLRPAVSLGIYEEIEDVYEASKEVRLHNSAARYFFRLVPLQFDDNRIDSLWNEVKAHLKLAVVRDREYLKWRYRRHPFYSYELWGLQRRIGGRLLGLAVLRRENERMLFIDFLCRFDMLKYLFIKVENYSCAAGSKLLLLWHPEFLNSRLKALGFTVRPSLTCIPRTTHELTMKKEDIKGNFFYTMGDTDFM